MTLDLSLLVIGKDAESFKNWKEPTSKLNFVQKLFINTDGQSMAALGNKYLDYCPMMVFGMCHADCFLSEEALITFYETALQGKVCGIVGRDPGKGNRWCSVTKDISGLVWTLRPGPVSTLDSSSVFFKTNLGLRFDQDTFNGFHCYVEDLCLQAKEKGIPVVVPSANASHRGDSTFDPMWQLEYRKYRGLLGQKWKSVQFETT